MTGPAAEVRIDEPLVRSLLEAQHPDLAGRPLAAHDAGWDNAVFRLGDDLAVRLPRRAAAAPLAVHEQRWLPVLAPRLPLATPRPCRVGAPGPGYPWWWSIVPWLEGVTLGAGAPVDGGRSAARRLGRFLRALHLPAPSDAPRNPFRGIALAARRTVTLEQAARVAEAGHRLPDGLLARFDALAAAAPHDAPPVWIHGDLHPGNVLVGASGVVAVLDFGDVCAGDPATDLAIAWMCFDAAEREVLLRAAGADAATAARAEAWAIALSIAYLDGAGDDPGFVARARRTWQAVGHQS